MKFPATIKDLAKELGLSDRAVSQALNPRKSNVQLSAKTIERVQKLAAARNYRPNWAARGMRARRFFNIGYFEAKSLELGYSLYGADSGIYQGAAAKGYTVTMVKPDVLHGSAQQAVPAIFKEARLDALVISHAGALTPEIEQAIDAAQMPVVYLNEKKPHNSVYVDDVLGATILTDYLLDLGHKRILFEGDAPTPNSHYSVPDRHTGYLAAMNKRGLTPLVSFPPLTGDWQKKFLEFLKENPADAILAANSLASIRVFGILYSAGIHVPNDVVLTGYGYDWFSIEAPVPITTMQIPFKEMGVAAAEMAIALADAGPNALLPSQVLNPTLFIRNPSLDTAKPR